MRYFAILKQCSKTNKAGSELHRLEQGTHHLQFIVRVLFVIRGDEDLLVLLPVAVPGGEDHLAHGIGTRGNLHRNNRGFHAAAILDLRDYDRLIAPVYQDELVGNGASANHRTKIMLGGIAMQLRPSD